MSDIFIPNNSKIYKQIETMFKELHESLNKQSEKNNSFTLSEFQQYEFLFSSDFQKELKQTKIKNFKDLPDHLKQLTNDFFSRINPFIPIKIYDDDKIVLELPPIFTPVNTLSSQDNIKTLEKIKNPKIFNDPIKGNQLTYTFISEFIRNQQNNKSTIIKYSKKYKKCLQKFEANKQLIDQDNNSNDHHDIGIENLEGIDWE